MAAAVPPLADDSVAARRERSEAVVRALPYPHDDGVARFAHRLALPGRDIAVRVYRPRAGRLPGLLYLHGGGWVVGSLDTHDGACAWLAREAGVVVASVDYRLAPEHPFPAPNDDALAALEWLHANAGDLDVDAARIAIGGDSAGAHLAIGAAMDARDRGGPAIALQLLLYPVIARDFDTPSYLAHAQGPTLTRADMQWFWNHYAPAGTVAEARLEPASGTLRGLPPAYVVVAGLDPLRDEGAAFAAQLRAAGVATAFDEEPALPHGFLRAAPYVPAAERAMRRAANALKEGLA